MFDGDMGYQVELYLEQLEDLNFDLISWYMQYLDGWSRRDWRDECVSTDEEDNQITETHTCSHDHLLVACGMANRQERTEPSTGQEDEAVYDDLPGLIALSDENEDDDYREKDLADDWFWKILGSPIAETSLDTGSESVDPSHLHAIIESITQRITEVLTKNQPFPGDERAMEPMLEDGISRFAIELIQHDLVQIYDRVQGFDVHLHLSLAQSTEFAIERWYAE